MTRQEAFDKAVRGLASQGFKRAMAVGEDGVASCAHQIGDLRCAFGWVMPDDFLARLREDGEMSSCAAAIFDSYGSSAPGYDIWLFISQLQRAHDNGATPQAMWHNLESLAIRNGLRLPLELAPQ